MITGLWVLLIIAAIVILFHNRASLIVWTIAGFIVLILLSKLSPFSIITLSILWVIFIAGAVFLNIKPLRRNLVSRRLLAIYRKSMPSMSDTEREAIATGTVYWGGELFTGMPDWGKMLATPATKLTKEEQDFLDGPVEELCHMINEWEITHKDADMPPKMWQFIKDNGFFGMIIPKKHGGKEFSASAHSAVIVKVAAYSITVSVTIAVPNSLGPAELLLKYGTEKQKNHYLPRLAKGEEIPCFALTGPEAGSDATALTDSGVVCKGKFKGKNIIGIRLNFDKRYITLAPVATVIGLAFKLYDPDHLIGKKEEYGITCALVPRKTPGVKVGLRHYPLNIVFQNGPVRGKDVFIPLDWIIGGVDMAGQGWRMLVECLSVGRGITLPAISAGGAKLGSLATGAYSRIRRQFGIAIGCFEGIEEPLTRIAGYTYMIDAIREMTVSAIDRGEKPAVLTAIVKYHTTTRARIIANDVMDIHGGKGICLGPKNYIGRNYQGVPISITVEGANILTRSMLIFGQGALRCHPYLLTEVKAIEEKDFVSGLRNFDKAVFAHFGMVLSNAVRSIVFGLTSSKIMLSPQSKAKRYLQHMARFTSAFALLADFSLLVFAGGLKRKEKISARLGDILSYLFLASAILNRFHQDGQPEKDFLLVRWTCEDLLYEIQQQLDGVLKNFPNRLIAAFLRVLIFPIGMHFKQPSDRLGQKVARLLLEPNATRTRLTKGICVSKKSIHPMGRLEEVFQEVIKIEPLERKIHKACRKGKIKCLVFEEKIKSAVKEKIISKEDGKRLLKVHRARMEIIAVDEFKSDELTH